MIANQPILKFLGHEISRVVFDKPLGFSHGEFEINFEHLNHVNNENQNIFSAEIIVNIKSKSEEFNFQIQSVGFFEIIGDANKVVYDNFLNISAPTILYPFIRAFVSNFSLQSGMNPILIPTINFGNRNQKKTD
jgi:preprotein translocase subunit SecB